MTQDKRKPASKAQTPLEKRRSLREPLNSSEDINLRQLQLDIKKGYRRLQKTRYRYIGKQHYKSDRWLWTAAMVLIMFWLWFIAHSYHYNLDYFKCGDDLPTYMAGTQQPCKNPFYKPYNAWKSEEYLPPGEYGQKPGPLFNTAIYVIAGILALTFLANHWIYNRRRSRT